jgi:hypothetical protein
LICGVAACEPRPSATPHVVIGPADDFELLGSWPYTGIETPRRAVLTDLASWQAVWAEISARQSPPPPLPAVDFARNAVVVVASGERSSGGYDITIAEVRRDGSQLLVTVVESAPGAGCISTGALTQPVAAAVIPATPPAQARFVDRSAVNLCS